MGRDQSTQEEIREELKQAADAIDRCVDTQKLEVMRASGGTWAAYRNVALDSSMLGDVVFLRYGADCKIKEPPAYAPDGPYGSGWRYTFFGLVDLEAGKVLRDGKPR